METILKTQRSKVSLLFFAICFSCSSMSQSTVDIKSLMADVPASPQARALSRITDYSVSPTGMPEISLPLYEVDFNGYKIPLQLHYEALPLKPGYNYDVYGRGWTLSGVSCVSRTIRSCADEERDFRLDKDKLETLNLPEGQEKTYFDNLENFNFRYDLFNVVLPNSRNIPFYIHREAGGALKYELLDSDSHLKIQCSYSSVDINSFEIIDEEGIKYIFDVADKASNTYLPDLTHNVTWLLSNIEVPNRGRISFYYRPILPFYTPTQGEPTLHLEQNDYIPLWDSQFSNKPKYVLEFSMINSCWMYNMRFLDRITYGPTVVKFTYTQDGKHLQKVNILDGEVPVREIVFDINNTANTLNSLTYKAPSDLNVGADSENSLVYKFSYTNTIPGSNTDHWGNVGYSPNHTDIANFNFFIDNSGGSLTSYLNHIGNLIHQTPHKPTDFQNYYKLKLQQSKTVVSRQSTSPSHHGILSRITYPNGGSTWFEYELHRFVTHSSEDGSFELDRRKQRIAEGGGFRIKSVINYNADGTMADQKHYKYGMTYGEIDDTNFPLPRNSHFSKERHIGCGEPVVDPNILTFLRYDRTHLTPNGLLEMIIGKRTYYRPGSFEYKNRLNPGDAWWWTADISASNFQNLLGNRPAVVYPEITVYYGDIGDDESTPENTIGKTVYKYNVYDYGSPKNYLHKFRNEYAPDTAYLEPVCFAENTLYFEEHTYLRNRLMSKTDYAFSNEYGGEYREIARESYEYTEDKNINSDGLIYNNAYSIRFDGNFNIKMSIGKGTIEPKEWYSMITEYIGTRRLSSKTLTKTINNSGLIKTLTDTEHYTYAYGDHLKSKKYWDNGERHLAISYVGDSLSSGHAAMIEKNMLAYPICTEVSSNTFNGSQVIDGQKVIYGAFNNSQFMPSSLSILNKSSYILDQTVLSYTESGHPTEVVDNKTNMHIAYLWGYNDRYLVAEVKNASYAGVINAIQSQGINLNDRNLNINRLNAIRTLFPKAMINTWTYIPLIGASFHTDECYKTQGYQYDAMGRLIEVSDYVGTEVSDTNKCIRQTFTYSYPNL